jgi:acyl-CoA thioesterase
MAEEIEEEESGEGGKASALPNSGGERQELKTHVLLNQSLCGYVEDIQDDYAKVRLVATEEMIADKRGLIHYGFIFGAANFAAVAAVNKPNALMAVARCNFLAPLKLGDEAVFEARAMQSATRKRTVEITGTIGKIKIFDGEFSLVITDRHPLNLNLLDA